MDRIKFLIGLVIVLLLINMGTLAYLFVSKQDQQNKMPPMRQKGGPAAFIIKTLKFTTEQEKQFFVLRDEHRSQMDMLHDSMKIVRNQYFDELKTDVVNTEKANQLNQAIASIQSKMHQITFDHFTEVRKMCTAEQRELFDEFIDKILRAMAPPPQGQRPPHDHKPPPRD